MKPKYFSCEYDLATINAFILVRNSPATITSLWALRKKRDIEVTVTNSCVQIINAVAFIPQNDLLDAVDQLDSTS